MPKNIGLPLRKMWVMIKTDLRSEGLIDKRDLALAREFFYLGAHSILNVIWFLHKRGHAQELKRTIERYGRQLDGMKKRARRRIN